MNEHVEGSDSTEIKPKKKKTLIGALSSAEDPRRHRELVMLLDRLVAEDSLRGEGSVLKNFAFVFTGGTFQRILYGIDPPKGCKQPVLVENSTRQYLLDQCEVLRLPHAKDGGVVFLTYLVIRRMMSIVWSFLTPTTSHWLQPENVALMRLCDHWHVNRLLNAHSVEEWFPGEAILGTKRNLQNWPLDPLEIKSVNPDADYSKRYPGLNKFAIIPWRDARYYVIDIPRKKEKEERRKGSERRLALIAHDHMKERMIEFAVDYENELASNFDRIITTSTTGTRVKEAAPALADKIFPYHSGPKGGDVEIATEIMLGLIDVVIFFIDPLHPHPHIDDIRVVFGACMMLPVRMLTNERQAREWMERTGGLDKP